MRARSSAPAPDPKWTSRLTAPFTFLYRPFILWPVVAGFVGVCWFVLFHKGIASATRDAMNKPALLVLVFALALLSAGFHELGHAAATRYGVCDESVTKMTLW